MTSPRTCSRSLSSVSVTMWCSLPLQRPLAIQPASSGSGHSLCPACRFGRSTYPRGQCGYPARHEHERAPGPLLRDRQRRKLTPFLQLDYLYTPSTDVAADARFFTDVLGGKLAFAVEGMGARV